MVGRGELTEEAWATIASLLPARGGVVASGATTARSSTVSGSVQFKSGNTRVVERRPGWRSMKQGGRATYARKARE
jgi:hypothetical protein